MGSWKESLSNQVQSTQCPQFTSQSFSLGVESNFYTSMDFLLVIIGRWTPWKIGFEGWRRPYSYGKNSSCNRFFPQMKICSNYCSISLIMTWQIPQQDRLYKSSIQISRSKSWSNYFFPSVMWLCSTFFSSLLPGILLHFRKRLEKNASLVGWDDFVWSMSLSFFFSEKSTNAKL